MSYWTTTPWGDGSKIFYTNFPLELIIGVVHGILQPSLTQTVAQTILKIFESNYPEWTPICGDDFSQCKRTSKKPTTRSS